MKKAVALLLTLGICMFSLSALAAEWSFPVSVTELMSDHARLVNRDHLLEESYKPEDLVAATVKRASSSKIELRKEASEALTKMFEDAQLV